jgi:Sulfotransferase domain
MAQQRLAKAAKRVARAGTRPTSGLRLLPQYLIIGAQRAGTTSLHRYLIRHPSVGNLLHTKGVHYFDTNYGRGLAWYRSHFPTDLYRRYAKRRAGVDLVVGEASPYYLFHPQVPRRVASDLPDVKLIVLLRDPVARAYSQYQHEVARGFEHLTFEQAIEHEPKRLAAETDRLLADPTYNSFSHQHHSYLARGVYVDQLKAWRSLFPEDRMLVLGSEEFFGDTDRAFQRVLAFLGLPSWRPPAYEVHNAHRYGGLDERLRAGLVDYFAGPNRALYSYLGRDFGWST